MANNPSLEILLAEPRGFCAGVDRAIQIVDRALDQYGAPVYVRHEIVHNKYVVDSLRDKGAIFIEELDEIPAKDKDRPVIFSAHGVPKSVPENAKKENLFFIDATCPLVSKVHRETERHYKNGYHVILVGHKGHPEVIGTMGQIPEGHITLVETVDDVARLDIQSENIGFVTQTTLSVDDTESIVQALKAKYPSIHGPVKEDICYATTNRQSAVKEIAAQVDFVYVLGAPNSSNSNRLVEVAKNYGAKDAKLVQRGGDVDASLIKGYTKIGLTAGASAPEALAQEVVETLKKDFDVTITPITITKENVVFKLPKAVAC